MNKRKEPVLRLSENIRDDALNYRSQVEKFLKGDISPVSFRAYRVPMGIYEQRTTGKFMVRIRIGAGLALPFQLQTVAKLGKTYGDGILHITTRQDIQIHNVRIENTPDILESLLEVGLSSRGGGGNTVRNITACPEAGVCLKEEFDVTPYALAIAEYLLKENSSFNLPRKYKIAFSGCSRDCAYASVADLGFFAHIKNGKKGFAVYAGGGLGSNPAVAVKIEDFIKPNEIFETAESIKRLFDKLGDRSNKHKARLRYVLAKLGTEEFIKRYKNERQKIRNETNLNAELEIRDIISEFPVPEKSATIRLHLNNGDIPADDLGVVAKIADKYGQGLIRTTQLQDMLITGVAIENINSVNCELKNLTINVFGNGNPKIVACAGASTCKLGLCLSRGLSDAISQKLSHNNLPDSTIRISGCPNSCGHHYIADIGFQGKAKRINGRLMPCYDILTGAKTIEGDAHLAQKIGTVPARNIPDLLAEAVNNGKIEKDTLKSIADKYEIKNEKKILPVEYHYDWDSQEPFSLAGRGPGECGAGVMDVIKLDIEEAKDAIKTKSVDSKGVYKALVTASRALLVTFGLEPKKDREIFSVFSKYLIKPGWVKNRTQQLLDDAFDWKMGDIDSIENLLPQVKDLISRIEELFLSLDSSLNFKVKPIEQKKNIESDKTKSHTVDLLGVECPLNFVKAKLELEKIEKGDILEILLDDGEPVKNVPASFAEQGHNVLEVKNIGKHYRVKIQRKK